MEKQINIEENAFINKCLSNSMKVDLVDVRLEVADHVACGIEAKWIENPELDFYKAYRISMDEFGGGTGIEKFISFRKKALRRQFFLDFRNWFKLNLTPFWILLSFCFIGGLIYFFESTDYFVRSALAAYILLVIEIIINWNDKWRFRMKKGKRLLIMNTYTESLNIFLIFFATLPFLGTLNSAHGSIFSGVITYMMLLIMSYRWIYIRGFIREELGRLSLLINRTHE